MAPYCAIPRDYLSDTPYCALWGFWCLNMANWVRYPPPPFLSVSPFENMRSGGAIPPPPPPGKRGISAILARYPMKTRQMGAIPPSAILSRKGIARYGGVSRTGPLRFWGGNVGPLLNDMSPSSPWHPYFRLPHRHIRFDHPLFLSPTKCCDPGRELQESHSPRGRKSQTLDKVLSLKEPRRN